MNPRCFWQAHQSQTGTHRSFALSLPSCHTVTLRATLQLGFDTIICYRLPWVFGFCYRHQICNYYRTATPWHNKKAQWVRVPLPSPMACLGPGTHGVKGTLQSIVPILQRFGHPPPTHTNKCSFERNSLIMENKDFQCFPTVPPLSMY